MKKSLILFGLLLTTCFLFGQTESYDISNYLLSDFERKTLSINPQFGLDYNNTAQNDEYSSGHFGLGAYGTSTNNSRKKQSVLSYNANTYYSFFSKDHPDTSNKSSSNKSAEINTETRLFFKPKRYFEAGGGFGFRHNNSAIRDAENRKSTTISGRLSPKLGFGRIENISDAWHAVTIIEELQKAGCIKEQLTHEEITALADEIRRLKNNRNVDFRLENIYEFEQLAKYMVGEGIASADEYRFFAILEDAYSFEDFALRQQGQAFTIGLEATGRYSTDSYYDGSITSASYVLELGYENNKAISNDLQFDQSYELSGGLRTENSNLEDKHFVELNTQHSIGYYLSRRTNFKLPIRANITRVENQSSYFVGLEPQLNYYFSPQLRFTATGYVNLYESNYDGTRQSRQQIANISAGFNYFIY